MDVSRPTLWVGAHPDDIAIGCGIAMKRKGPCAHALTITTGVIPDRKFPVETGGYRFSTAQEYATQRMYEDIEAMQLLGVNPETQYTNLQIDNLRTHFNIPEIIHAMQKIIEQNRIEQIVTHEIPQSHPDHEVTSLCSHYVGQQADIEVWEYPMYGFDTEGAEINRLFLSDGHRPVAEITYTTSESILRNHVLAAYPSQDHILEQFKGESEVFGRIQRDLSASVPEMAYIPFFSRVTRNVPQPKEIRTAMQKFLRGGK